MKDHPKSMSAEEYRKRYVTSKKPLSHNMTARVFQGIFDHEVKSEKRSMSAEEWRAMMKKNQNKPKEKNKGEIRIMLQLARIPYIEEHRFHPDRKWRFDFAIPEHKIAIEYEGIYSRKSGHTTHKGYTKDTEKYNEAAKLGWTVLRYTANTYKRVIDDITKITEPSKKSK